MLKEFQVDGMPVRIYENRTELGAVAAFMAAEAIKQTLREKETANVIFAAAPSQNEMLAGLAASDVDFSRVRAFHMDEYPGLPDDAPQRFSRYLDEHIFGKAPFKEVYYLCRAGENHSPEQGSALAEDGFRKEERTASEEHSLDEECLRYSELLRKYPVDVTLMGIGENGHIAFNDPHVARFDDPETVKRVVLDETCRAQQVHDGCFPDLSCVPKEAVTLTVPALMSAKHVICVVPGETKREAVTRTVNGDVSEDCPATVMRKMNNSILLCDRDSGRDLL